VAGVAEVGVAAGVVEVGAAVEVEVGAVVEVEGVVEEEEVHLSDFPMMLH
jgi:hypothetical protein